MKNKSHVQNLLLHAKKEIDLKNYLSAETYLNQVLKLIPTHSFALVNLIYVLTASVKDDLAIEKIHLALQSNILAYDDCITLGSIYYKKGHISVAINLLAKAISLNPKIEDAYIILGGMYIALNQHKGALPYLEKALLINPTSPNAHNNLSIVWDALGDTEKKIFHLTKSIQTEENIARKYHNQGLIFSEKNDETNACQCYLNAVKSDPTSPVYNLRLAGSLVELGELKNALAILSMILRANPNHHHANVQLSIILKLLGNYEEGFKRAEFIKGFDEFKAYRAYFKKPYWNGENIDGKKLLVFPEQGFGDIIHFSRYFECFKKYNAQVYFPCPEALINLLNQYDWITFISQKEEVEYDYCISINSLPFVFKTTLETIPPAFPLIQAKPDKIKAWKLQEKEGLKVGFFWAGNPQHKRDKLRSCPLEQFNPLFELDHIQFYSLQKGSETQKLNDFIHKDKIVNLGEQFTDFSDTAAVISQLDLIIGIDTSVIHLAGAMGKKTWLLLPFIPDWRWLLERTDSPWYPSIRLYRQKARLDWSHPILEIRTDLEKEIAKKMQSSIK